MKEVSYIVIYYIISSVIITWSVYFSRKTNSRRFYMNKLTTNLTSTIQQSTVFLRLVCIIITKTHVHVSTKTYFRCLRILHKWINSIAKCFVLIKPRIATFWSFCPCVLKLWIWEWNWLPWIFYAMRCICYCDNVSQLCSSTHNVQRCMANLPGFFFYSRTNFKKCLKILFDQHPD